MCVCVTFQITWTDTRRRGRKEVRRKAHRGRKKAASCGRDRYQIRSSFLIVN